MQEVGRTAGVVVHLGEQLFAPWRHAAADGGDDGVARQEIAGGHRLQLTASPAQQLQRTGQVGVVLEAVVHHHLPAVVPQRLDLQPLIQANPGCLMVVHGDKQVLLVQYLVVLEVVQQGIGYRASFGRQEDGRAIHPGGRADEDRFQKVLEVDGIGAQLVVQQAAPFLPGHHEREHDAANHQREPAALEQLEQVGGEERQVHHKEAARGRNAQRQRIPPAVADDEEGQRGGDQHVQRHRNAVGCGQIARRAEHHHRQHDGHEQPPVDQRHVDLARIAHAGVLDVQARQVAQLDDLLGHAERAGDQRLRSNHGGHGGQDHQRHQRPVGCHQIERVLDGLGLGQQQRALAKIIEGKRRHGHTKPGHADRALAEVAQVGIQSLGARHAQHYRAQNDETGARVGPHETQRVVRAERPQDLRVPHDVRHAQQRDGDKPHQRDGAKKLADAARAALLHGKQAKQHHQRDRDHVVLEVVRHHLQPLHRRQHRDGRGDNAIAIEQRGAKNTHAQEHAAQLGLVFDGLGGQGQHGDEAALAVVVGAQHQHHVLQRDDDREGPEKDGEDAVDVRGRERHMAGPEHLLDGIQHAGADIAIHNTDGAQRERCER